MQSWGDVNVALNGLVREGVLTTFRTNREANADPEIRIVPARGVEPTVALVTARAVLTGTFEEASVSLAD